MIVLHIQFVTLALIVGLAVFITSVLDLEFEKWPWVVRFVYHKCEDFSRWPPNP
jgi:hypothetical protein